MTLGDWQSRWMMLALVACRSSPPAKPPPAWTSQVPSPKVSAFDAPPLANAKYFAVISPGDRGNPGPLVGLERGAFTCVRRLEQLQPLNTPPPELRAQAEATCPEELARSLGQASGAVYLDDGGGGRWLAKRDLVTAAGVIDTAPKALLAVWANGSYELNWVDDKRQIVGLDDGRVRAVSDGFEVAATLTVTKRTGGCGDSPPPRERATIYLVTLFVDATGAVRERERHMISTSEYEDDCHTLGRRPSDFEDVASGGTLVGYLRRSMHHEAESVRAFERIARELAFHGAPAELVAAARDAANDERDHARRCARLVGAEVVIASDMLPIRSLVELAIDNAREGCVGEAFAALVAVGQSTSASSAELRAHFSAIAADELAHAALACAIAEWIGPMLAPDQQRRVRATRCAALAELAAIDRSAAPPELGPPDRSAWLAATEAASAHLFDERS